MIGWGAKSTVHGYPGRFESQGVSLAYETAGEGPPVVLVHGFASSLNTNWKSTGWFDTLVKEGFQVVALDNRGHGESDKPRRDGAYAVDVMARDVAGLIDHLGLRQPCLFGYSMGARIVLSLLMQRPQIASCAVIGGAGAGVLKPLPADGLQRMSDAFDTDDPGTIKDTFARRFRLFADRQKGDIKALGQCYREVLTPLPEEGLHRIGVPVLVAIGEKDDHIVEPRHLADLLPQGRFVSVPDKDHMTVIADPRYKTAIIQFLKSAS